MLEKRPEDRYATPAEVAAELAPFCEGHDLAALVHGYLDPGSTPSSLQYTRIDSGADRHPQEPCLVVVASQPFVSLAALVAAKGFAAVCWLLIAFGGLLWSMKQSQQRAIDEAMEQARNNLPSSAEQAAEFVGKEIEKRFSILQNAAAEDGAHIVYVEYFDPDQAREKLESYCLANGSRVIARKYGPGSAPIVGSSSTSTANRSLGIHCSKAIPNNPSIASSKNFAHRDYFHGQGKELPEIHESPEGTFATKIASLRFKNPTSRPCT